MCAVIDSGGGARRLATGVAVTTIALGLFGAVLAVAALARAQLPLLDGRERAMLVLRWAAIGALPGLVAGVAGSLVARPRLRWVLISLLIVAIIAPVLLAGRRSPSSWASLGAPAEYPPLPERRAAPGA